jgi:hypothetical protein
VKPVTGTIATGGYVVKVSIDWVGDPECRDAVDAIGTDTFTGKFWLDPNCKIVTDNVVLFGSIYCVRKWREKKIDGEKKWRENWRNWYLRGSSSDLRHHRLHWILGEHFEFREL